MKLGIIGLGAIGYPIAQNLLHSGYELYTTVRTEKSRKRAERLGIHVLESPQFLYNYVNKVILFVSNHEQCKQCLYAEDGIFTTLKAGLIILGSTIAPNEAQALIQNAPEKVQFIDAPVSGGISRAKDGTLVCIAAGEPQILKKNNDIFSAYCQEVIHVGNEIGQAQKVKAINQMLVSINIIATAEAANLARASDLELNAVFKTISKCAGNSFVFQNRMPKLIERDFTTRASIETMQKDTKICLQLAQETNSPCFLTNLCHELYKKIPSKSIDSEDACAVIRLYEDYKQASHNKKSKIEDKD